MGCGCNKKGNAAQVAAARNTVYQVLDGSRQVVAEFNTLPEARTKAQETGGSVRVASKTA